MVGGPFSAWKPGHVIRGHPLDELILFVNEEIHKVCKHDPADPVAERILRSQIGRIGRERHFPPLRSGVLSQGLDQQLAHVEARLLLTEDELPKQEIVGARYGERVAVGRPGSGAS